MQTSVMMQSTISDMELPAGLNGGVMSVGSTSQLMTTSITSQPQSQRALLGAQVLKQLVTEFQQQRLDSILFATYRTACKLRHIQKRCLLHLVDLWNMIEAFRENGLNQLGAQQTVNAARVDALVSMLYSALQKRANLAELRLDDSGFVDARSTLVSWLVRAFDADSNGAGHVRVFALKCVLSTLSAGRLVDKLKYHFTLVSDQNCTAVVKDKLDMYFQSLSALPAAVFEGHNFPYSIKLVDAFLQNKKSVSLPQFVEMMLSESAASDTQSMAYFPWLLALGKLAAVECIAHSCRCEGCHQQNFVGFRYRCRKCHSYNLCQQCFWTGVALQRHPKDHLFREYTFSRKSSVSREASRNSQRELCFNLQCSSNSTATFDQSAGASDASRVWRLPSSATATPNRQALGNTNTFPGSATATPRKAVSMTQVQNGDSSLLFNGTYYHETLSSSRMYDGEARNAQSLPPGVAPPAATAGSQATIDASSQLMARTQPLSISRSQTTTWPNNWQVDDDHRLIAQYAARLKQHDTSITSSETQRSLGNNLNARIASQKESIRRLERSNRELMLEIQRLQNEEREQLRSLQMQNAQRSLSRPITGVISGANLPLSQSMPISMLPMDASRNGNGNSNGSAASEMQLYAELKQLRAHKDELESRMLQLKDSRRELITQLETLMRLLKTCTNVPTSVQNTMATSNPAFTANASLPNANKQRAANNARNGNTSANESAPTRNLETPPIYRELSANAGAFSSASYAYQSLPPQSISSGNVNGNSSLSNRPPSAASTAQFTSTSSLDVQVGANSTTSSIRNLHSDLLLAADSVTNAITSLVRELNSEAEASSDDDPQTNASASATDGALSDNDPSRRNGNRRTPLAGRNTSTQPPQLQPQPPPAAARSTPFEYALERAFENEETNLGKPAQTAPYSSYAPRIGSASGSIVSNKQYAMRRGNPLLSGSRVPSRGASASCTDDESCLETDVESYIRTDDEDGGNTTDFEESMMRWVNR